MRKLFVFALLAALSLTSAWGALPTDSAQQLVRETADRMMQALRTNQETLERDSTKLYGMVNQIVLPHFDFPKMSQWVLGKYWRQATAEQRQRFTDEFRTLLVRTYASSLLEYADDRIVYPPLTAPAEAAEVTVSSEVEQPAAQPIQINYRMHEKDGAWKVYDVSVNGVSLVTNYRSSFASQIRNEGMDTLIRKLSERNDKEGR